MGQARVVDGPGEKAQVKDAVGVVVGDVHQLRAGALMLEEHDLGADQREVAQILDDEALDCVAQSGQRGRVLGVCAARRGKGRRRQQHREDKNKGQQFFHLGHVPPAKKW